MLTGAFSLIQKKLSLFVLATYSCGWGVEEMGKLGLHEKTESYIRGGDLGGGERKAGADFGFADDSVKENEIRRSAIQGGA